MFHNKSFEEIEEYIKTHTVGMDDSFQFGCQICGKCCKNRHEPIILAGYDLFRIAKHYNKTPEEIANKYCVFNIGGNSHLPVLTIKEREYDGTCSFSRRGRCELHQSKSKPVVCGLFPLGRIFNYDKNDVTYFTQDNICGNNNETHTVRDWLNDFGIDELEDCSAIWQETIAFAGAITSTVKNEQHQETLAKATLSKS